MKGIITRSVAAASSSMPTGSRSIPARFVPAPDTDCGGSPSALRRLQAEAGR